MHGSMKIYPGIRGRICGMNTATEVEALRAFRLEQRRSGQNLQIGQCCEVMGMSLRRQHDHTALAFQSDPWSPES